MKKIRGPFFRAIAAAALAFAAPGTPVPAAMNPQMHLGFANLYSIMPGETLVLHVMNGPAQQDAQVCLFEASGAQVSCVSQTLNPAGSDGDGLTYVWKNGAGAPADRVVGVGLRWGFEGSHWIGSILSSDQRVVMSFDKGAFIGTGDEGHAHASASAVNAMITEFQNYPNPMRTSQGTHFAYALSGIERISQGTIRIWSEGGRLVRTLDLQDIHPRGTFFWDGKDQGGSACGTGIYVGEMLIKTEDGNFSHRLKVAVIGG